MSPWKEPTTQTNKANFVKIASTLFFVLLVYQVNVLLFSFSSTRLSTSVERLNAHSEEGPKGGSIESLKVFPKIEQEALKKPSANFVSKESLNVASRIKLEGRLDNNPPMPSKDIGLLDFGNTTTTNFSALSNTPEEKGTTTDTSKVSENSDNPFTLPTKISRTRLSQEETSGPPIYEEEHQVTFASTVDELYLSSPSGVDLSANNTLDNNGMDKKQHSACSRKYQNASLPSKLVVMWTPFWHRWDAWKDFLKSQRLMDIRCPFWRCEFEWTEEGSFERVQEADAVVFFSTDLFRRAFPPRQQHQLWIWLNVEAPPISQHLTGDMSLAESRGILFNMTMSYHHLNAIVTSNTGLRPLDLPQDCPLTDGDKLDVTTPVYKKYSKHLEYYDALMKKNGLSLDHWLLQQRKTHNSHAGTNITQRKEELWRNGSMLNTNIWYDNLHLDNLKIEQNVTAHSIRDLSVLEGNDTQLKDHFRFAKEEIAWASRPKLAVWMASNCFTDSKREDVISVLQRYVQVTTVGKCGKLKCGKNHMDRYCYKWLAGSHLFYLSFENSLCEDYYSEKLWRPMEYGMVPVVYGKANYKDVLPPGSYIDLLSFPNIESLAKYLVYLVNHPVEYLRYFQWRRFWKVDERLPVHCNLCRVLHEKGSVTHQVTDLDTWWNNTADCYDPLV